MQLNPYLALPNPEEALQFYADIMGGEIVNIMRNKDFPNGGMPNVPPEIIMHMHMESPAGAIMATQQDPGKVDGDTQPITMRLGFKSAAEGKVIYEKLADGGTVIMPFEKTFWAAGFGMCADKYGIHWMIDCDE